MRGPHQPGYFKDPYMRTLCSIRVVSLALMAFSVGALAADGGLTVPSGFTVAVVQEGLGAGRHLAIAANGDIYLAGSNGLVAMRDTNGDGKVTRQPLRQRAGHQRHHSQDLAVRLGRRRRVPVPVEEGRAGAEG
jgi:hypothetical protein